MKLHLPGYLFVTLVCAASYAAADAPVGTYTVEYSKESNGPDYGLRATDDGSGISKLVTNIADGAKMHKSVTGGLELNDKTLNYDFGEGPSIKDGVVINMTGGEALSIKGGNAINTNAYMQAVRDHMGDALNVGSIQINVSGGTLGIKGDSEEAIMGGGGRYCGTASTGGIEVNISGGTINNLVYAGTNGGSTGHTQLNVTGGVINADVFGGGRKSYGVVEGNTTVALSGGVIDGNVYAAGNEDTVKGNAQVVVTGAGSEVSGVVSGSGTNGSKVEGQRTLLFDAEYTGDKAYSVGDFRQIDLEASAILDALETASEGTLITVEAGKTLTLGDVSVSEEGALIIQGGNVTLASGSVLDLGGTSITLEGTVLTLNGEFTVKVDSLESGNYTLFHALDGADVSALNGAAIVLMDGNGATKNTTLAVSADGSVAVVPEPTTATLSLLALCGLAARRRRK